MKHPDYTIEEYHPRFRDQLEEFREQTFRDGNQSLAKEKFDPDNFNGKVWIIFVGDKLVSLSACEASHYTSDPIISARAVRLHTVKGYRSTAFGMSFFPHQVEWCTKAGFKVLWWSIDINESALNAIYQRRHVPLYSAHEDAYEGRWKDLTFSKDMLFMVDPRAEFLQYVYYIILEDGYKWVPKSNMIYVDHDGDIKQDQVKKLIQESSRWRPNPA